MIGDGPSQLGNSRAWRILISSPLSNSVERRLLHHVRPVGVRKTLTQIDRSGGRCQLGHFGEYRRSEGL